MRSKLEFDLKSIYQISELYMSIGLTRDSNSFLYIFIETFSRAEISQYPSGVYIKLQVLKYMTRISNKDNNPLLLDAYSLSKTLHLTGTY
jgi:hypothetical protein